LRRGHKNCFNLYLPKIKGINCECLICILHAFDFAAPKVAFQLAIFDFGYFALNICKYSSLKRLNFTTVEQDPDVQCSFGFWRRNDTDPKHFLPTYFFSPQEEEEEEKPKPKKKAAAAPARKPAPKKWAPSESGSKDEEWPSDGGGSDYEPVKVGAFLFLMQIQTCKAAFSFGLMYVHSKMRDLFLLLKRFLDRQMGKTLSD
jgi:hypothetical protein